ncbi:MAG: 2-amino-4-hydroxy-6-hydroxymethyldihydropteridine diphosphokinase [Litorilinea sp.]
MSTFHFVILLGSNLNKDHNMRQAQARLAAHRDLSIQAYSAVLDTPAVDSQGRPTGQPSYLNMAVRGTTKLDYVELRAQLRQIEAELGRVRNQPTSTPKSIEVPIDLDIALFGADLYTNEPCRDEHISTREHADADSLHIHPDVASAMHAAVPIAQILPDWIHPQQQKSIQQIARTLMDTPSLQVATRT